MSSFERLLHLLCGGADGDVARGAALLEDLHVVDGGVAVELVLVPVEGVRELTEMRVARVDPAGSREAVPVALRDDVGTRIHGGEVCRNDAIVAGEHRRDAEAAEHGDEVLGRV